MVMLTLLVKYLANICDKLWHLANITNLNKNIDSIPITLEGRQTFEELKINICPMFVKYLCLASIL